MGERADWRGMCLRQIYDTFGMDIAALMYPWNGRCGGEMIVRAR